MKIPHHHTPPNKSIDITIPSDDKLIKEVMKGIKHLDGHFNINIKCEKDISKYLKSMRNIRQSQNTMDKVEDKKEDKKEDKYEILDNNRYIPELRQEEEKYDKYEILDNNREVKDEIENIEYNI
jgi:hypothetical protein